MEDLWKDITTLSSFHTPLTPTTNTTITNKTPHHGTILRDFLSSGDLQTSSPVTTPVNSLNLNAPNVPSSSSITVLPCFGGMATSNSLLDSFLKKRSPEFRDDNNSSDRKYKRMMKNRESAARSRARRTAYTFELEKEKFQLVKENDKLRRILQGQQLLSAVNASANEDMEAPKKRNHLRSLSAMF